MHCPPLPAAADDIEDGRHRERERRGRTLSLLACNRSCVYVSVRARMDMDEKRGVFNVGEAKSSASQVSLHPNGLCRNNRR